MTVKLRVQTIESMLSDNIDAFRAGRTADYIVIAFAASSSDAVEIQRTVLNKKT